MKPNPHLVVLVIFLIIMILTILAIHNNNAKNPELLEYEMNGLYHGMDLEYQYQGPPAPVMLGAKAMDAVEQTTRIKVLIEHIAVLE